jgi:PTS system nitrogen regulatory IIA component
MRLSDLLSRDRIDTGLKAPGKGEALTALADLLSRGLEGQTAASILPVLRAREAQQSTGVGDEVAIPHGRIAGLTRLVAAIAIVPDGVDFESIDRRPVRILVAILAPENSAGDHLRALARVAKLLRDGRIRQRLIDAPSPEDAFRAVVDEESTLPP